MDANGSFVPNADNLITFNISGPADNIGVENGDALDLASTTINQYKSFRGKCLMILESQKKAGVVQVEASVEGLPTETIEFTVSAK